MPYVLMDNRFSSEKEDCTEPLNGRLHRQSDSTYRGFLLIWQRAISVASNDILNYSIRDFVLQQVFEILWGFFILNFIAVGRECVDRAME